MIAVRDQGNEKIVKALLHYGADPDLINNAGQTALQIAQSKEIKP